MGKHVYVLCDSWFRGMYEDSNSDTYILGVFESKELAEEAREKMYNRTKESEPSFEYEPDEETKYSYNINEFNRNGNKVNVSHRLMIYCYQLNQLALII